MKLLLIYTLAFLPVFAGTTQNTTPVKDTASVTGASHSLRLIANVKEMNQDYMIIVVEEVVSYSPGIMVTPESGDEILVRLPGREMPKKESRIEVDLQEKIDVGALPSGYIMTEYRTIR